MWPVARAIFPVFFIHSLFREVDHRRSQDPSGWPEWNHSSHATMLVIMLIVSHIVDRMAGRSIGSPVTDFISLLFLIPVTFAFASAQEKINQSCGDPEGKANDRLTAANIFWIVFGVIIWALVVMSILMPE